MIENPKTPKSVQQEAFLGRVRQLGLDNLPDKTIFMPMSDFLEGADLFDVKLQPRIKDGLTKVLSEHKDLAIRVEATELVTLDKSTLKAWINNWIMSAGVFIIEAQSNPELLKFFEEKN